MTGFSYFVERRGAWGLRRFSDFTRILSDVETRIRLGANPADVLLEKLSTSNIDARSMPLLLHHLLVVDLKYPCRSVNLPPDPPDPLPLNKAVSDLKRFHTVMVLHRREAGLLLVNPLQPEHWQGVVPLDPFDLMVVYTRRRLRTDALSEKTILEAIITFFDPDFASNHWEPSAADAGELPHRPERSMSPSTHPNTVQYPVSVTNEFFHYGNVEAWQNIIESYEKRYPETTLTLYHRGRKIPHVASLFRWGKVRIGDVIFFKLSGTDIRDVPKLKKYLSLGAGPGFLPFIKKDINRPLSLF